MIRLEMRSISFRRGDYAKKFLTIWRDRCSVAFKATVTLPSRLRF